MVVSSELISDLGRKTELEMYLHLDSLQEYWIASASEPIVTQYVRQGDEWIVRPQKGRDAVLHCETLDLEISLEAIYVLVEPGEDARDPESSASET